MHLEWPRLKLSEDKDEDEEKTASCETKSLIQRVYETKNDKYSQIIEFDFGRRLFILVCLFLSSSNWCLMLYIRNVFKSTVLTVMFLCIRYRKMLNCRRHKCTITRGLVVIYSKRIAIKLQLLNDFVRFKRASICFLNISYSELIKNT